MRQRPAKPVHYGMPLALLGVLLLSVMAWHWVTRPFLHRYTLAITTQETLHIISLSANRTSAVVLVVPMDTVIEATHAYGNYRLDSLLGLDALEKKQGGLFVTSISHAFGVPIDAFVQSTSTEESPFKLLRDTFEIKNRPESATVPLFDWLRLVFGLSGLHEGAMEIVDLSTSRYTQELPDGSKRDSLDTQKADFIIGSRLYDAGMRHENKSVAVYNTTKTPLVGTKAAAMLAHVGISVLSVGNNEEELDKCRIGISPGNENSITAQFLVSIFDCTSEIKEDQSYDIVLFLGKANAMEKIN